MTSIYALFLDGSPNFVFKHLLPKDFSTGRKHKPINVVNKNYFFRKCKMFKTVPISKENKLLIGWENFFR